MPIIVPIGDPIMCVVMMMMVIMMMMLMMRMMRMMLLMLMTQRLMLKDCVSVQHTRNTDHSHSSSQQATALSPQ